MACNNKMTLREALRIQASHLNAFGSQLTFEQEQELRRRIAKKTWDDRPDHILDEAMGIPMIDSYVPRGREIEREAARIRAEGTL